MKTMTRIHLVSLALVGVAAVLTVLAYGKLPDPVPTHWNVHGEVDGYTAKPLGPFLLPLAMLAMSVMFMVLPRISPRRFEIEGFDGAYGWIILSVQSMLLLTCGLAHLSGMGFDVDIGRMLSIAVGLLFMVMGNFMGKVTRNFFLGIRTPWTLSSEEVWLRTHRFAGKVFVLAGFLFVVAGLLQVHRLALLPLLILMAVVPSAYSFVLYRRLESGRRSA